MSRSNPSQHIVHPCQIWLEWNGKHGCLEYYDKTKKERVLLPSPKEKPMKFIFLDELAGVAGYNKQAKAGITSNEVRSTATDNLVVKIQKGATIASGLYSQIKDTIKARGGYFSVNVYAAVLWENKLQIASIRFAGASLNAWIEFSRPVREKIEKESAVRFCGVREGENGGVTYYVPAFDLGEIKAETNAQAIELDRKLQVYLEAYLKRNAKSPVESGDTSQPDAPVNHDQEPPEPPSDEPPSPPLEDDDVPF